VSTYLTEQQQVEQITLWWKKYGLSTIIIFIIALAAGIGWRFWLQHREVKLERGSTHYEELLNAVVNDDKASAMKEANLLKSNYRYTPYAALATLMLARGYVYQNDYANAETELSWVMKHASANSLREIARLRFARILLQEGKPQETLKLLQKIDDIAYIPVIEELKGDSYMLLKQNDNARAAYQQALHSIPDYTAMRPILAMKLDNLATGESHQ
jgi:predicted negative regulator of RcsB-dependent stress response